MATVPTTLWAASPSCCSCAASASIGSRCLRWFCQKRLIRLARPVDHSRRKISFSELWDLFIFLGLDTMGIKALKIRVDFAFSRGGGENDVVLVHLPRGHEGVRNKTYSAPHSLFFDRGFQ